MTETRKESDSAFTAALRGIRALREDQAWATAYQAGTREHDLDKARRLINEALSLLWKDREHRIEAMAAALGEPHGNADVAAVLSEEATA